MIRSAQYVFSHLLFVIDKGDSALAHNRTTRNRKIDKVWTDTADEKVRIVIEIFEAYLMIREQEEGFETDNSF
jgi:hypothetical protein